MMKWYGIVRNDNTADNPYVSNDGDLDGLEDWMFRQCRPVEDWLGGAWVRAADSLHDGEPDDNLQNHFGLLIFSRRLQRALARAGIGGIQFLPIHVLRPNEGRIDGFCIANILACVSALDLERSTYSRYPDDYFLPERRGKVNSVRQATLRRSGLEGHDIVRLADYKPSVYVSGRFKEVFEQGEFTGLSFHQVKLS